MTVCNIFVQGRYVTVPQLQGDEGSHRHQGEHEKKLPHHGELQQSRQQKPVTTVASSASVSQHCGSRTEHHAAQSKTLDYANLPPEKGYVAYTVPPKSQGEVYRAPKPPKASPRSVSMNTHRDTPLLPTSSTPKTTSMPEQG